MSSWYWGEMPLTLSTEIQTLPVAFSVDGDHTTNSCSSLWCSWRIQLGVALKGLKVRRITHMKNHSIEFFKSRWVKMSSHSMEDVNGVIFPKSVRSSCMFLSLLLFKLPIRALLHGDYLNYGTSWWIWFGVHLLTCVCHHDLVIYLQQEDVKVSWYSITNGIFWIQSIFVCQMYTILNSNV